MVLPSQILRSDSTLFSNKKRFDIFISFHGEEMLECIGYENRMMKTREFVDQYLVNAIKNMWKLNKSEGEPEIFFDDDSIFGNLSNRVLEGISSLQVVSDKIEYNLFKTLSKHMK